MKSFLVSRPILSFILITFAITFSFWFAPVLFELPPDIDLGLLILGGCGPLIAGYVLTLLQSGAKIKLGSKTLFALVFLGAGLVLFLRLAFEAEIGQSRNGLIPGLQDLSIPGILLYVLAMFIPSFLSLAI